MSTARKRPDELRSHRWFGRESMRTFNHRSRMAQLAPGQRVSIVIVGISTSGVSCIGILTSAMPPNSATRMTPTITFTGFCTNDAITPASHA